MRSGRPSVAARRATAGGLGSGFGFAVALLIACAALAPGPAAAQPIAVGATTFRFATVDEGRAVLGREDDWTRATSEFQRRAVVGGRGPVSVPQLVALSAAGVQAWPPAAEARWRAALESIAPRLQALRLPFPAEVLLVASDGRDSAGAPHTRGNAVVLPLGSLPPDPEIVRTVLAHELFHVVSRHDPALATRLYATLGFEPVPPLDWPAAWQARRLANPDAPFDRHAMRLVDGGRSRLLMPLLVASRTELKPGETFFSVLQVRIVEVVAASDGSRSTVTGVTAGGEPPSRDVAQAGDYLERLGGNTPYVIHPEETMADNVAFLVVGRRVANPALLQRIEGVLLAPR